MRYWLAQIGRALSRLLNALFAGEGDCTFSAWSWELRMRGSGWGPLRVRVVDWLNRTPGHCETAWQWHAAHGLLAKD